VKVSCLSLHAGYVCQHRGECCRTWQVPAEPHVLAFVRTRRTLEEHEALVRQGPDGSQRYLAHRNGACVFRLHDRCAIQQTAGEMALPVSCRHFPRVILRDARGTLIALSHYCGTAAALLFAATGAARAVNATAPLALSEPLEGLDARDALPPLIRPDMLSDMDGYEAWEQSAIDVLAASAHAGPALDTIERVTERVRRWTPRDGELRRFVRACFGNAGAGSGRRRKPMELEIVRTLYSGDVRLHGRPDLDDVWRQAAPDDRSDLHRAIGNYVAARFFGNWVAHQGRGLRSVVAWARACHDVLRAIATADRDVRDGALTADELLHAIRLADLVMLHSIDSHEFAGSFSPREA
jgi:hypothetical protein